MDFFLWFQGDPEVAGDVGALLLITAACSTAQQFLDLIGLSLNQVTVALLDGQYVQPEDFASLHLPPEGCLVTLHEGVHLTPQQQVAIDPICRNFTTEDKAEVLLISEIVDRIEKRRKAFLEGSEGAVCVACSEDLLPEQQSLLVLPPGYKPVSENLLRDDAHCGTSALHRHMRRPY